MKKIEGKFKKYLIIFVVSGILSGALSIFTGIIDVQRIKKMWFRSLEGEWFYPENYSENWEKFLDTGNPVFCSPSIRVY